MSLECGECERDLRGGHDEGCSRFNPYLCAYCNHDAPGHFATGYCAHDCDCTGFVHRPGPVAATPKEDE